MGLKPEEIEDGIERGILKPQDGKMVGYYLDRDYCTCNTPYFGAGLHREHCLVARFESQGNIHASEVLREIIADRWKIDRPGQPPTVIFTDYQIGLIARAVKESFSEALHNIGVSTAHYYGVSTGGAIKLMVETFAIKSGEAIGKALRGQ